MNFFVKFSILENNKFAIVASSRSELATCDYYKFNNQPILSNITHYRIYDNVLYYGTF